MTTVQQFVNHISELAIFLVIGVAIMMVLISIAES